MYNYHDNQVGEDDVFMVSKILNSFLLKINVKFSNQRHWIYHSTHPNQNQILRVLAAIVSFLTRHLYDKKIINFKN